MPEYRITDNGTQIFLSEDGEEVDDVEDDDVDRDSVGLPSFPSETWRTLASTQEGMERVRERERERLLRPRRVTSPQPRIERDLPTPTPAVGLRTNDMSFRFMSWQSEGFDQVTQSIYPFFSRHGDRHYSEATMRQLANISLQYSDWTASSMIDRLHSEMPVIVVASMPFGYDEETEVKTGGTTGMLVCFPNRGFKSVLAVHRNGRRSRIATTLWQNISYRVPSAAFWVHRSNAEGQHFLLSLGFYPTAMNSSGSVRYSQIEDDE